MRAKIKIENMHCNACAASISMFLSSQKGINKANVDYKKKLAEIDFNEKTISLESIIRMIKDLGYEAKKW